MPCYEVRTTRVEIKNVTNLERLVHAMNVVDPGAKVRIVNEAIVGTDSRGRSVSYSRAGGLEVSERSKLAAPGSVARVYAEKTVRDNARRFGWMVKKLPNGKLEITR